LYRPVSLGTSHRASNPISLSHPSKSPNEDLDRLMV
jgi:hypothetical protein